MATKKTTSEQKDDEREWVLKSLMDHLPTGITVARGREAKILYVSKRGLDLIGQTSEAVTHITAEAHPDVWNVYYLVECLLPGWDGKSSGRSWLTQACRGEKIRGGNC